MLGGESIEYSLVSFGLHTLGFLFYVSVQHDGFEEDKGTNLILTWGVWDADVVSLPQAHPILVAYLVQQDLHSLARAEGKEQEMCNVLRVGGFPWGQNREAISATGARRC